MTGLTETPPVLAAYSNASLWPNPDTSTPKRSHVLRCSRPGCRDNWPKAAPEDKWRNA
jgi:hypothetical protein